MPDQEIHKHDHKHDHKHEGARNLVKINDVSLLSYLSFEVISN